MRSARLGLLVLAVFAACSRERRRPDAARTPAPPAPAIDAAPPPPTPDAAPTALQLDLPATIDEAGFWASIDLARSACEGDWSCFRRALEASLGPRDTDFRAWFRAHYSLADRRGLHFAFYVIQGGCSDDCFDYAIPWLIAQGRAVYAAALRDPDSLAALPESAFVGGFEQEELLGLAFPAHPGDPDLPPRTPSLAKLPPDLPVRSIDDDEPFMKQHFPRLHRRFW